MRTRFVGIRFTLLAAALALVASGCKSRGIHVSGFLTPTYRSPSGYSETYRKHLLAAEPRTGRKELLDPALSELPPPAPYAPPPAMMPEWKPTDNGMRPKERMPFPPAPAPEPGAAGKAKQP